MRERGRISPTEALRLLCQHGIEPMQAAVALTNAIHASEAFPVWCNRKVVKPRARPDIRVVARKVGPRWVAEVRSISHQWRGAAYSWEFDADKVRALREVQREGQSKPGSADFWIDDVCPNEWRLMTAKAVHGKIEQKAKKLGVVAPSYSAVAAALAARRLKRQT